MKNIGKYLFLFVLSMVNTSIAGLVLYISPVLSYVGSVDQIPLIMEGLLSGALISSFAGFFIWLFAGSKQKILLSLSLAYSLILFAATMSIYFIDGPPSKFFRIHRFLCVRIIPDNIFGSVLYNSQFHIA